MNCPGETYTITETRQCVENCEETEYPYFNNIWVEECVLPKISYCGETQKKCLTTCKDTDKPFNKKNNCEENCGN